MSRLALCGHKLFLIVILVGVHGERRVASPSLILIKEIGGASLHALTTLLVSLVDNDAVGVEGTLRSR